MGCTYILPTFTLPVSRAGVALTCDSTGALRVAAADQTATNATDGQATSTTNQHTLAFNYIYNGTTWDRARGTGGAFNVNVSNPYATTTGNALEPATAASGKITVTSTSVTAATNTTIAAANTSRIAYGIQCAGTAAVNVSETGATLTAATFGATGATLQIPAGSTPPYFSPPVATRTAITAYTGTTQTCVVTEYNR